MELTLTVHLPRRRPDPVDVQVRWSGDHDAAELVRALGVALGTPIHSLTVRGSTVSPTAVIGRPPLLHGAAVTAVEEGVAPFVNDPAAGAPAGPSLLELAVVGGPDAGRSVPLSPPGVHVGRSVPGGLSLADDALSRVHAALDVDIFRRLVALVLEWWRRRRQLRRWELARRRCRQ
jgi:S-DNA-T family DNA segregation ATPase FtsK/SpoIIIE